MWRYFAGPGEAKVTWDPERVDPSCPVVRTTANLAFVTPLELTGLLLVLAAGAGLIGSLIGLGGGVLLVPILTLGFHVDIRLAIATSIVAVVASSVAAAPRTLRTGFSSVRLGVFLAAATTLGGLTGALVSGLIDPRALYALFGTVLLMSGAQMVLQRRARSRGPATEPKVSALSISLELRGSYHEQGSDEARGYVVQRPVLGLSLMYVAGAVSGFLGIGAGVLKVPAMDVAMRLPFKVSAATSNFLIGVTASAGAIVYLAKGGVDPYLAGPVAIGMLAGAWLGGHLFTKLAPSIIRWTFLAVLGVVATQMLAKALGA